MILQANDVTAAKGKDAADEIRERQLLCNELGASQLVLKFATCESVSLSRAGLELGCALLSGCVPEVQVRDAIPYYIIVVTAALFTRYKRLRARGAGPEYKVQSVKHKV